jgi:thiamine-monophosphate kinase
MDATPNPRRLGEFAMIAKLFAPLAAKAEGAFGLLDDVATLRLPEGQELVAKVDAIVESVHFLRQDPADLIARKALRVNLSDLAAKGAEPMGYLLSLSVASWCDDDWLARFAAGLAEDQEYYGIALLGGDTTSTPGPLTLSITALGTIAAGRTIRRAGAKPGDCVFVSGSIGDAAAGLAILSGAGAALSEADRAAVIARYRLPEPRLDLGRRLIGLASAALDVSDGLIADLGHIAEVSQVRICVDGPLIPLSLPFANLWGRGTDAVRRAATAGDDYEIAFTAPEAARSAIAAAAKDTGIKVREIGRVEAGEGVVLLDEQGKPVPIERAGFTHF